MQLDISGGWILFCLAFGIVLLTAFIMSRQSRHFYTMDVVLRRFSIMDLQLPDSPLEMKNLIGGIYKLPPRRQASTLRSLKSQLYVDYIFMPAAYGAIFLLCMKLSLKMTSYGQYVFAILAWLQVVAFIMDIIENIYLLKKIHPGIEAVSVVEHKRMLLFVQLKWGIALVAIIFGLSAVLYFWLVGRYDTGSLKYLLILAGEIVLFLVAGKFIKKIKHVD